MRWKRISNLITALILSVAYVITTLLNIIGPLHMNSTGNMNPMGTLATYSLIYLGVALFMTWCVYFYLRKKPEALFFTLIIIGIVVIITENFLWGFMGS